MQQQQQTVIINQVDSRNDYGQPQNQRPFSTGLCGCCEDCGGCCFAWFFPMCFICTLANRMNECCCLHYFVPGALIAMRLKIRTQFGITGSICDDCMCVTCCQDLTMCQLDREMKHCGM